MLSLALAAGQAQPSAAVVLPGAPTQAILDLSPGQITCDGVPVRAVTLARPAPAVASLAPGQTIAPFTFKFRIDADGRPLGIAPEARMATGLYFTALDLQPALAASRFAAGAPKHGCVISYDVAASPIADASIDLVYRYFVLPHDRNYIDAAVLKRVRDASADCSGTKPPKILTQVYPDYDLIPQPSGALSMSVTGFDIDASGRPVRVRTVASDGNARLDAAARGAVSRSRFGSGVRTGCTAPALRRQSMPLAAPPPPDVAAFRKADSGCDEDGSAWLLPPKMTFPEPFRRRGIEGWAIIRYDVAPWGQTGNVTILASEPAAMFGEYARNIITTAKRPPSARGATGCVDRVLFRLPEGMTEEAPTLPPPLPAID